MTRISTLEVLDSEYVRFGRVKGLSPRALLVRHVVQNSMLPVITVLGLQVGYVISGTIYVEMVFDWPGIGSFAENAITNLDYPSILGVTLLFAAIYVIVNFVVDMVYMLIDPRIRLVRSGGGER